LPSYLASEEGAVIDKATAGSQPVASDSDAETTALALPRRAQARRAAAEREIPNTPVPGVSIQIARATLHEEEAYTTRYMIRVGRILAVAALVPLPFIGGHTGLKITLAVTIVLTNLTAYIVERRALRPGSSSETGSVALGYTVTPLIIVSTLFFGLLSAVQLWSVFALYFFSRRERFAAALTLYSINAVAQAVMGILFITGAFHDPGLASPNLPPREVAVGHGLLQVGFLCAFLLGRSSHKAARDAIQKMQHAMVLAAQREALLIEARQDLERALAIDAAGRFTSHTLGSYRLGHVIGRGGMGEVYEAVHIESGEIAAVKLLGQRQLGDPHSIERFLREVRVVRSLTSPHVVRVFDAGEQRDEIPYLVMERLHGDDLAHHLRSGKMSPTGLLELLEQVGSALEEAWSKGIVHRDIKPHNLILADVQGRLIWKVLDFGVAALDEGSGTLTQGKVVGTPAYMAPEQARGQKVDHRADIYALGAIAYRCLTGRQATSSKDLHHALYQTVHVMPQRPSELADLHADVDAVLAIALVKQPDARWQSGRELCEALAQALQGGLSTRARQRAADILAQHDWGAVRK
jgi:serine/threonine-protein kinase